MKLLEFIRNRVATAGLEKLRRKVINPAIENIGVIDEVAWQDRRLLLKGRLNGLEDRPVEIICSSVSIAPDCSSITLEGFDSNMPFIKNALESFIDGKTFAIPADRRPGLQLAKTVLGL